MFKLTKTLAALAAVAACGSAMALPTFTIGTNVINFKAYENQYRAIADCTAATCMTHNSVNDPVGFNRVNPALTGVGAVRQNDVFVGIFKVDAVQPANWGSTPVAGDQFNGYFVQKVANVTPTTGTNVQIDLVATADPFATGKLAAGAMFALYTSATTAFNPNGTTASTIATATSGSLWAALGLTSAVDTYAYTLDDYAISGVNTGNTGQFTKSYLALDILTRGPSYNAGLLAKVNDLSENLVGGTTASGLLVCGSADLAPGGVYCSDIVGNADVKRNSLFGSTSPWYFEVNDPLALSRIPEPASLALVGLSSLGLGLARRRSAR